MRLLVPLVWGLFIAGCLAQYDDQDGGEDDGGFDEPDDPDQAQDSEDLPLDESGGGAAGAETAAGIPITQFDYPDPFFPQSLSVALITINDRICNGALIRRPGAGGVTGHFVLTSADCVWEKKFHMNQAAKKMLGKKPKEMAVSGDWRISDLTEVQVEFGVTNGEAMTTCGVQDVRINRFWPMDTAAYFDKKRRRNDFAVLVLANECEGVSLDGAKFMPFKTALTRGGKLGKVVSTPKRFVRAAYNQEKQLMAYPEDLLPRSKKSGVEKYAVKTKGLAQLTAEEYTSQIGAPVFLRTKLMAKAAKKKKGKAAAKPKKRKPLKKNPYLFGLYQFSDEYGAQVSLKTSVLRQDVDRLMKEGAGFSPLIKACSDENVNAASCWSTCSQKQKVCWKASDGKKQKYDADGKQTKPCGLGDQFMGQVQRLCGKAKAGNGRKPKQAKTKGKKKASAMMSWNGDEYDYGYENEDADEYADEYGYAYENEDGDAYEDEDEDADAALYDELDEMFNSMFIAGYKQGLQEQQNKRRYRYQY